MPKSTQDFREFVKRYNQIRASSSPESCWLKFNRDSIISKYVSVDMVIKNG